MENAQNNKNWIIGIIYFISCIPLPIYPFILLANVMALGGNRSDDTPLHLLVVCYGFFIFSTLYPLTWLISIIFIKQKNIKIAMLPLIHALICLILFFLWMYFDN